MMREIKFRGKGKDTIIKNQIIYGDLCIYNDIIFFIGITKRMVTIRKNVFVPNVVWYEVEPKSVGQFTGIKDKNGKEIYEGDIFDSPSKNKFKVVWWIDGWFYQNCSDEKPIGHLIEVAQDWEVIGNIYENPELIEEK